MSKVEAILKYPDPRLLEKCIYVPLNTYPLEVKTDYIRTLIDTAKAYDGVGLAANQIGWNNRVAVIFDKKIPIVIVNPTILKVTSKVTSTEGCLSLPGQTFTVTRFNTILLKYLDQNDKSYIKEFKGLLARAVQHELDHMNGRLLININNERE